MKIDQQVPQFVKILGANVIANKKPSNWEKAGYWPVTGQAVGIIRIVTGTVAGLVTLIGAAILAIRGKNTEKQLYLALLSGLGILRGCVELTSPIGGIGLYFLDKAIGKAMADKERSRATVFQYTRA